MVKIERTLGILLAACFVLSVTIASVSAFPYAQISSGFGNQPNYSYGQGSSNKDSIPSHTSDGSNKLSDMQRNNLNNQKNNWNDQQKYWDNQKDIWNSQMKNWYSQKNKWDKEGHHGVDYNTWFTNFIKWLTQYNIWFDKYIQWNTNYQHWNNGFNRN